MVKEILKHYIWLIDTIQQKGRNGITHKQLDEKWQQCSLSDGAPLAKSSFHRTREEIEDIFGIRIVCDRRTNCYHIEENLSDDLHSFRRWMLDAMALDNLIGESLQIRRRILLEPFAESHKCLSTITQAMKQGVRINFSYAKFGQQEGKEAGTIDEHHGFMPYAIKSYQHRWYLLGTSDPSHGLHTYGLDRMTDISLTDMHFTLPSDFDAEQHFCGYFGVYTGGEVANVEIHVSAQQVPYFRTRPLHASQREKEDVFPDGSRIFTYRIAPTNDFMGELLRRGRNVEVLSPAWFREKLQDEAKAILKTYSKKTTKVTVS